MTVWSYRDEHGNFTGLRYNGPEEFLPQYEGLTAVAGLHAEPKPAGDEFTDHELDAQTKRWVPVLTLAGHQRAAWERVKQIRDEKFAARRMAGSIAYRISADRANLESLIAGRTAAGVPAGYAANWRDADNLTHALDAAGLAALAGAMLLAGQAIYDRSWALKAQIDACTTEAEIAAIDLGAGWP